MSPGPSYYDNSQESQPDVLSLSINDSINNAPLGQFSVYREWEHGMSRFQNLN